MPEPQRNDEYVPLPYNEVVGWCVLDLDPVTREWTTTPLATSREDALHTLRSHSGDGTVCFLAEVRKVESQAADSGSQEACDGR